MHEGDEPDALVDLFDSDHLACEDLAQVDLAGFECDAAAGGDDDSFVVKGVIELGQASIGACAIKKEAQSHPSSVGRAADS